MSKQKEAKRPSLQVKHIYSVDEGLKGLPRPNLTGVESNIPEIDDEGSGSLSSDEPAQYSDPKESFSTRARSNYSIAAPSEVDVLQTGSNENIPESSTSNHSPGKMNIVAPIIDHPEYEDSEEERVRHVSQPRVNTAANASLGTTDDKDFLSAFSAASHCQRQAMVVDYWRQVASLEDKASKEVLAGGSSLHPSTSHRSTFTRSQIDKYINTINKDRELEMKEQIHAEVRFIQRHFRQRRCKQYYPRRYEFKNKFIKVLESQHIKFDTNEVEICHCGLTKRYHSKDALEASTESWTLTESTEAVQPWNFGNVDIVGHYSYLDLPQGTRKYLRLDDTRNATGIHLYRLLTQHWGLRKPNLVVSITGGDIFPMYQTKKLHEAFRNGILKTTVNTKAWIVTEGLYYGSSREIGEIFQTDLKRSEWSEIESHADIPLIAIAPWGILASKEELMGIYVGSTEAKYNFNAINNKEGNQSRNALDPYHTAYILADDGTHGFYGHEPEVRTALEWHIKKATTLEMMGGKEVTTPLVILVVGGDRFTLTKVAKATSEQEQTPVVIVNGSGLIANMLAETYKELSHRQEGNIRRVEEFSSKEETTLSSLIAKYKDKGLLSGKDDAQNLREIMKSTYLITVFGVGENDEHNLDRAILNATFGAITDIKSQLNLTLAMSRVDVAKEKIFVESRKEELSTKGIIEDALFLALTTMKSQFVQLLIDQDLSAELNFNNFLTMKVLHTLYRKLLNPADVLGLALVSITKKDPYGNDELDDCNLLPQVGRIIHCLMGNHYRLLYQEQRFRDNATSEKPVAQIDRDGWSLCKDPQEEAVWHMFLWAVMANNKEIAEHFLFETSCKIGGALIACKMLKGIATVAEVWQETELVENLKRNAEYFETLALKTIDNMYGMNRDEAYASLVAVLPFRWGQNVTPLSIADDAECMRFMGHACPQTLLNLIWMQYMDLDTPAWKLAPFFSFFPFINLPLICFDPENLEFGTYAPVKQIEEVPETAKTGHGDRTISENDTQSLHSETGLETHTCAENFKKRFKFAMWCIINYYTSPVMKFVHGLVAYVIFLAIFSHMVLSKLKPIDAVGDITSYEWLVYVWVGSILFQEINQLISRKSSGPLYHLNWQEDCVPNWSNTWHFHERVFFVLQIHRIQLWLSDRWNKIDALMIIFFAICVVLRFTVPTLHFVVVRFFFAITLIFFFMRLLRLGYILKDLGPRIITIRAMVGDLLQFFLILSLFIISFGIAFQGILSPNETPSWNLLVDILWRTYWQMFGELFVDDEGMGRNVDNRECYTNRTLAKMEDGEMCYDWMATLLLAIFMLITNIMLLNLLIAIFSNSFEKIESESRLIWRYHIYDLVHEYYESQWLPPPLNLLCMFCNFALWISRWPRRWAFLDAKRRYKNKVHAEKSKSVGILFETESIRNKKLIQTEIEELLQKDCMYRYGIYYTDSMVEQTYISHFRQEEFMRNEDMEEKAYKRYRREVDKERDKSHKIKDLLKLQSHRLLHITSDLGDVKHQMMMSRDIGHSDSLSESGYGHRLAVPSGSRTEFSAAHSAHKYGTGNFTQSGDIEQLKHQMQALTQKVDDLQDSFERQMAAITPILNYVSSKSSRRIKKKNPDRQTTEDLSSITDV